MNFEKIIWRLFKLDRSNHNKADREIEKILLDVYNKGKVEGAKEEKKRLRSVLNGS